jgi:hypothetical protein
MKLKLALLTTLSAVLVYVAPVAAHHSFAAEYDANKPIKFTGKVTKVEWTNPHARFYLDVVGADGKVTNWNFELGSPNVLKRAGWERTSLKEGDSVTVEGTQAKDGSLMGNARSIKLSDGRQVLTGSSQGDAK